MRGALFVECLLEFVHAIVAGDCRIARYFLRLFHGRDGISVVVRHFDAEGNAAAQDALMQEKIDSAGHVEP
nr:MAG TPA: hypothetical protein [Caudoviricetes sp.]